MVILKDRATGKASAFPLIYLLKKQNANLLFDLEGCDVSKPFNIGISSENGKNCEAFAVSETGNRLVVKGINVDGLKSD
jgi:hypothetical protein